MQLVHDLEATFLPLFREAERDATAMYPALRFNVWSSSVGGATAYQGHSIGLECIFPDAKDEESDNVSASVVVRHLSTNPEICEASVEWGQGWHPDITLDIIDKPLSLSAEAIQHVEQRIPELLQVFYKALRSWLARGTGDA
jgi:hypothetical protein